VSAPATFYTVSDADFFPGTVGLLNSLRLTGHREDLVVLDNGLTRNQRDRLEMHVQVVSLANDRGQTPYGLKPYPFRCGASGTVVVIDSDVIVTASLAPAFALAEAGRICMFAEEDGCRARWFAEWEHLLSLNASPRRQEYFSTGMVALSTDHWPQLLERWWEACSRIPADVAFAEHDHPLCYPDSDALNALLMSEIPAGSVAVSPELQQTYASDAFKGGLVIADKNRLVCLNHGREVSILHHDQRPKVWNPTGRGRLRSADAYVRLLPRVLFADDVLLRLQAEDVPWWVRPPMSTLVIGSERFRRRAAIRTRLVNRGGIPRQ